MLKQLIYSRWAPFLLSSIWVAALFARMGWLWTAIAIAAVWIGLYAVNEIIARPHNPALGALPADIERARFDRVRANWLRTVVSLLMLTVVVVYYLAHQRLSMEDIMRSQLALFRSGAFDASK